MLSTHFFQRPEELSDLKLTSFPSHPGFLGSKKLQGLGQLSKIFYFFAECSSCHGPFGDQEWFGDPFQNQFHDFPRKNVLELVLIGRAGGAGWRPIYDVKYWCVSRRLAVSDQFTMMQISAWAASDQFTIINIEVWAVGDLLATLIDVWAVSDLFTIVLEVWERGFHNIL